MRLSDIGFTDIYIGSQSQWLTGGAIKLDPIPAPPEVALEIDSLRSKCLDTAKQTGKLEFAIRHEGVSYRASTMRTIQDTVFVLRRFPSSVPELDTIGLHPSYVGKLMQPRLSGLVLIAGSFGQGKTTTASAVVLSRLTKMGGVCVTIEDPPEMPLEGVCGEGVCYQTWVDQGGFSNGCRQAARWAPTIIFVGEIRDAETATEALRASINGCLVLCTIHSDNVIGAVDRIYSLANGTAGASEDVASLLASGLSCVLHQRLEGEPLRPRVEFLWLRDDENQGARNLIRHRRFDQLGSEITLQANRLMMSAARQVSSRP